MCCTMCYTANSVSKASAGQTREADKENLLLAAIALVSEIFKSEAAIQSYDGFSESKVNANGP